MSIRALVLRVYAPSGLFFLADGAVLALIALAARDRGASVATAGLIVGLRWCGSLLFDVPAGWLTARYGEDVAIGVATVCFCVTLVGWILTDSLTVFAILAVVQGSGFSVWSLARMTYLAEVVPFAQRGQAMSILGGTSRVGWFLGPFFGAGIYALLGFDGVCGFALVVTLASTLMLLHYSRGEGGAGLDATRTRFRQVMRAHARPLLVVGSAAVTMQAIRAARVALIPLWADHLGLSTELAAVIFGLSVGVETLLVYPGGRIMDRRGRKHVAVPSAALMALGLGLLPLAQSALSLTLLAVIVGAANGLSSGVIMTLGVDIAPETGRAQFLGAWRVVGDLGTAGGPLAVAAVTGTLTLGSAAVVCGVAGLLAAVMIARFVPETSGRGHDMESAAPAPP